MSAFEGSRPNQIEGFITIFSIVLKHLESSDFDGSKSATMEGTRNYIFKRGEGICALTEGLRSNLEISTGNLKYLREEAFKTWKYYSGRVSYPVPSSIREDVGRDSEYTFDHVPHWEGEQLELRKSLISHCIIYAKKELKRLYGV